MCIGEAKRLCPDLIVMPYQYEKYQVASEQASQTELQVVTQQASHVAIQDLAWDVKCSLSSLINLHPKPFLLPNSVTPFPNSSDILLFRPEVRNSKSYISSMVNAGQIALSHTPGHPSRL